MKPKLNKDIWYIFNDGGPNQLVKEKAAFLGEDSFLIGDYDTECSELMYENYNLTWFTSENKGVKTLIDDFLNNEDSYEDGCALFKTPWGYIIDSQDILERYYNIQNWKLIKKLKRKKVTVND